MPGNDGVRLHHGLRSLGDYRELFGDRCYALVELHRGPDDRKKLYERIAAAQRANVPAVAASDVRYHVRERRVLEDVLTAIRAGMPVAEAGELLFANVERHLKPREELGELFAGAADCLRRTVEAADRCRLSLDELRYCRSRPEREPLSRAKVSQLSRFRFAVECENG